MWKRERKIVVVILSIALLWTPGLAQTNSEFEALKTEFSNAAVISTAHIAMMEVEMKIPSTFQELCASPYIAIRCSDLKNLHAGRPVMNLKDSPGDIFFDRSNGSVKTLVYHLRKGKMEVVVFDHKPVLEDIRAAREELIKSGAQDEARLVSLKDFKHKAAYAVGRFLQSVLWNIQTETSVRFPTSFSDLYRISVTDVQSENPMSLNFSHDLAHLRNEFTGKYAHFVETPSPGDFYYGEWKNHPGYVLLEVYGENGKPVYSHFWQVVNAAGAGISYKKNL